MAGKENQIAAMQNKASEQLVQLPLKPMPRLPDDVRKRFPSIVKWEKSMEEWVKELNIARGVGEI